MKLIKLIFVFLILQCYTHLFSGWECIIPIFYDAKTQKIYGLFIHKSKDQETEWSPILNWNIFLKKPGFLSQEDLQHRLQEVFRNLYNQFQFDYALKFDFYVSSGYKQLNSVFVSFIPVKKFIPEIELNKLPKSSVDGFIWADLNALADQGATVIMLYPTGFNYNFRIGWKYGLEDCEKQKLQRYIDLMNLQAQQIATQPTQPTVPPEANELVMKMQQLQDALGQLEQKLQE